mmetsp:Transcript_21306/g.25367  ORF Transcript_21306/g.25367 Transcript_21306/m.25367 type:complete len:254 (-) Transcript_21306:533-1294(-)
MTEKRTWPSLPILFSVTIWLHAFVVATVEFILQTQSENTSSLFGVDSSVFTSLSPALIELPLGLPSIFFPLPFILCFLFPRPFTASHSKVPSSLILHDHASFEEHAPTPTLPNGKSEQGKDTIHSAPCLSRKAVSSFLAFLFRRFPSSTFSCSGAIPVFLSNNSNAYSHSGFSLSSKIVDVFFLRRNEKGPPRAQFVASCCESHLFVLFKTGRRRIFQSVASPQSEKPAGPRQFPSVSSCNQYGSPSKVSSTL